MKRRKVIDYSGWSEAAKDQIRSQITKDQAARLLDTKKKYGRYKTSSKDERTEDGIVFDSKWEAKVYLILKALLGLDAFDLQPVYVLQDKFKDPKGRTIQPIKYQGDFLIKETQDVIDTKGHLTDIFRLKHKMFLKVYNRDIHLLYDSGNMNKNIENVRTLLEGLGVTQWNHAKRKRNSGNN